MREEILGPLDPDQRKVVTFEGGDCLVLAGAGSGKTRAMQHRVAWLSEKKQDPKRIAAFSFTRRASNELANRISNLTPEASDATMGTFHSICFSMLREEVPVADVINGDEARQFIGRHFRTVNWNSEEPAKYALSLINAPKTAALEEHEFEEYWRGRDAHNADSIAQLYNIYKAHKTSNQLVDFTDMLWKFWRLLNSDEQFLEKVSGAFDHIIIDEVQDLNRLQLSIADLMSSNECCDLMCVGDIRQSLYGFRGANIDELEKLANQRDMERLYLTKNYRSGRAIVDASNDLIENGKREGSLPRSDPYREDFGEVRTFVFRDCREEAEFVADSVERDINDGVPLDSIACLYRVNAQSQYLEGALGERGIPYAVLGNSTFFGQHEVRDAIAYLTIAVSPNDAESLLRIYNTPTRYLGYRFRSEFENEWSPGRNCADVCHSIIPHRKHWKRSVGGLISDLACLQSVARSGGTSYELLEEVYSMRSLVDSKRTFKNLYNADDGFDSGREENLQALADLSQAFPRPEEFIAYCDRNYRREISVKEDKDRVKLMTIHRSKGTEFDYVYFTGCSEQLLPHPKGNVEEERRCAYVAMTRACERVVISSSWDVFGKDAEPSRFFEEFGATPMSTMERMEQSNADEQSV